MSLRSLDKLNLDDGLIIDSSHFYIAYKADLKMLLASKMVESDPKK